MRGHGYSSEKFPALLERAGNFFFRLIFSNMMCGRKEVLWDYRADTEAIAAFHFKPIYVLRVKT